MSELTTVLAYEAGKTMGRIQALEDAAKWFDAQGNGCEMFAVNIADRLREMAREISNE